MSERRSFMRVREPFTLSVPARPFLTPPPFAPPPRLPRPRPVGRHSGPAHSRCQRPAFQLYRLQMSCGNIISKCPIFDINEVLSSQRSPIEKERNHLQKRRRKKEEKIGPSLPHLSPLHLTQTGCHEADKGGPGHIKERGVPQEDSVLLCLFVHHSHEDPGTVGGDILVCHDIFFVSCGGKGFVCECLLLQEKKDKG